MSGKSKAIAKYLKYEFLEVASKRADDEDWKAYAQALEQIISHTISLLED